MPDDRIKILANRTRARMALADEQLEQMRGFMAGMTDAAEKAHATGVPVGAEGIMLLGCRIILEPPAGPRAGRPAAAPAPTAEPEADAQA